MLNLHICFFRTELIRISRDVHYPLHESTDHQARAYTNNIAWFKQFVHDKGWRILNIIWNPRAYMCLHQAVDVQRSFDTICAHIYVGFADIYVLCEYCSCMQFLTWCVLCHCVHVRTRCRPVNTQHNRAVGNDRHELRGPLHATYNWVQSSDWTYYCWCTGTVYVYCCFFCEVDSSVYMFN
jgi:hypothetical protein